ncbi:hypothetical protein GCM10011531_19520 [Aquaticitalea lipolytica]|uniref:DUF4129 domain-containing protein n=1 Tax=Aquaticitalea lipolytica TaxID=1247562 RepID=A0A8J2XHE4_9FLAO|nr:hypothetical protein [Aquaticitalea lipolytica]GFZ88095.1 hypothetical protein GCM10011531_19520 [Aquaticitalea lipolytica]
MRHILLSFLLVFIVETNYNRSFATSIAQEPQTERAFDKDFKDKYSGSKYNYEGKKVVNSSGEGNGSASGSEYKEDSPYIKEDNNSSNISVGFNPINTLFIIILILAVVYLAYTLLNDGSSGLFNSRSHKKLNKYGEITAENIENADIASLINDAENQNDYRLAIRYYYLLVLKTLAVKNYIKFEDDKTNADYLNEIESQKFSKGFAYTSYLYNYIWYGEFPLNTEQYSTAKSNFQNFLNQVK